MIEMYREILIRCANCDDLIERNTFGIWHHKHDPTHYGRVIRGKCVDAVPKSPDGALCLFDVMECCSWDVL
jgi:hypothetical protein